MYSSIQIDFVFLSYEKLEILTVKELLILYNGMVKGNPRNSWGEVKSVLLDDIVRLSYEDKYWWKNTDNCMMYIDFLAFPFEQEHNLFM